MKLSSKNAFLITFFFALMPPAFAQSGHTLQSVDTEPGTTAPVAPTDDVHPNPKKDDVLPLTPGSMDMERDAGSSKPDPKTPKKQSKRAIQEEQREEEREEIFPNERAPRFDATIPSSQK